MHTSRAELVIKHVAPQRATEALALAMQGMDADEQAARTAQLAGQTTSSGSPQGCVFQGSRGGRLVGAVLVESYPGGTAMAWPPGLVASEPLGTGVRLLEAACSWLADRRCREVHVLLPVGACNRDLVTLEQSGFTMMTELVYMAAERSGFPRRQPEGPLEFEAFRDGQYTRFARLVEATYQGTLDCPELDGLRVIDDVLAGYRAAGVFRPHWWLVARQGGRDAGCLVLADHPDQGNVELLYMGLKAGLRGQGWGQQLARHAQWLAYQAGRERLVLAADIRNWPALGVYRRAGFLAWDRRRVFWRVLADRRREGDSAGPAD